MATDSRSTLPNNQFCDDAEKIIRSPEAKHTVAAVTKYGVIYSLPALPVVDLCHYRKTAVPIFDVESVVRNSLVKLDTSFSEESLTELKLNCLSELQNYLQKYAPPTGSGLGEDVFQVVIGNYDPNGHTARVLSFSVGVEPPFQVPHVTKTFRSSYSAADKPDAAYFGETDYVDKNVVSGRGKIFLTCYPSAITRQEHISEVTSDDGECAARNLIEAASRTTDLIPAPSGIGGPVGMVLVGREIQQIPVPP